MSRHWIRSVTAMAILGSFASSHADAQKAVAPLLKTKWAQRGEFAAFAPKKQRLGCWSTAIAQILRYHQLQPKGEVQNSTRAGTKLHLDMDQDKFNWETLPTTFDSRTSAIRKRDVARYIYCVSLTIQKDFGTGSYMLGHSARAEAITKHYDCKTQLHTSSRTALEHLAAIIRRELDEKRPTMMHMRRSTAKGNSGYHAVAIDGYKYLDGVFTIHVNMGWGGCEGH